MSDYLYIKTNDYTILEDVLTEIFEKINMGGKEYKTATVVCPYEIAMQLLKIILQNKELGERINIESFSVDSDYEKEYYFTIGNDFDLWCEPAWYEENEYHKAGYLTTGGDSIYLYEECNWEILKYCEVDDDDIVIFGLEE